MKRLVSKLAVTAFLASSLPALAAARDREHDRDRYTRPAPAWPAPHAPAARPAPLGPFHGDHDWREANWREREARWREASWREREVARLRAEFRELDLRRAEFHARGPRGRGQVRRFERWYAARRAELELRWDELHRGAYAWARW